VLNGLDLFSGIGGISYALRESVRTVAYCECDRYAQAVLLSRMSTGELHRAPIWDDVRTFPGKDFRGAVDIIFGGFPCQDISLAGNGKGLGGERSGLFFEIMRLVDEVRPSFIFLENVPAITSRGLAEVTAEITRRGYDSRWLSLSAEEVGAPHKRNRWWLLAYSNGGKLRKQQGGSGWPNREGKAELGYNGETKQVADTISLGSKKDGTREFISHSRWAIEPELGRVANGVPFRVDRVRALGNSVVPQCAEQAFRELMGIGK
jgi:DNA (cytosine-5)-methyltransferase 1